MKDSNLEESGQQIAEVPEYDGEKECSSLPPSRDFLDLFGQLENLAFNSDF